MSCVIRSALCAVAFLLMTETRFPEGCGVKLAKDDHLMSIVAFYHKAPLKFRMDGCVKLAYPRGHDELLMIGLDNMKKKQTLLRTVPDVTRDGTFLEFEPHQDYKDSQWFPVTKTDDYEVVMVHHHPLQKKEALHGMGNYLLYMTPGACPIPSPSPLTLK